MTLLTRLRALLRRRPKSWGPPLPWWHRRLEDGRLECWAVAEIETNRITTGPYGQPGMADYAVAINTLEWGPPKHRVVHLIERTP